MRGRLLSLVLVSLVFTSSMAFVLEETGRDVMDNWGDGECDMNDDVNEWRLHAEYNWSQNPNMTISGNGDGDGNGTRKNTASAAIAAYRMGLDEHER